MFRWYKKCKKKKWIWIGAVLGVLLAFLITVACFLIKDMNGKKPGRRILITLPKGAGSNAVARILKEEGIIEYPTFFKLKIKADKKEYLFRMGGHFVDSSMSYDELLKKLSGEPDIHMDETVKITVPEGYEVRQIAQLLEEKGLADSKNFIAECESGEFDFSFVKKITRKENRLEGYLFPATYEIIPGTDDHRIIEIMLEAFEKNIVPLYEQSDKKHSLDDIIIMASIVEREAANDSERGRVASVFYNRIEADMTLSSCATVQYIIKERKPILSNSDIKIRSPYNTYINKGLPVGPIASPGIASVKAALVPEETDYYYFVAKMDGSANVFAKTGEEHMSNVNKIQGGN